MTRGEPQDGSRDPDAGSGTDASADDAAAVTDSAVAHGWASGGTAAMTALASYPNPFIQVVDGSCTPT
jgi:hypothetical protein